MRPRSIYNDMLKSFRESKLPDKDTKHNVNKLLWEVMNQLFE